MKPIRVIANGLQFPEGPIAMPDGSVIVVEIGRGTLTRVLSDGRKEVIAKTGGGPNGAAIGPDGACYVCNNGGFEWEQDSRSGGLVEQAVKDRAHIEARPANQNGHDPTGNELFDARPSRPTKRSSAEFLIRLAHVDKMVWDASLLASRRFRRTDIHVAKHLTGIHRQNLAADSSRHFDSDGGLRRRRGTCDRDQETFHCL